MEVKDLAYKDRGKLNILKQSLSSLLDNPSIIFSLIDAERCRYVAVSRGMALSLGWTPESVLSCNPAELLRAVVVRPVQRSWEGKIYKMNDFVYQRKKAVQCKALVMMPQGFIKVAHLMKVPIVNQQKKVSMTVSHTSDLTDEYGLIDLFKFYRMCYKNASSAVSCFLKYFGLMQYFYELPTVQELQALLILLAQTDIEEKLQHLGESVLQSSQELAKLRNKLHVHLLREVFAALV